MAEQKTKPTEEKKVETKIEEKKKVEVNRAEAPVNKEIIHKEHKTEEKIETKVDDNKEVKKEEKAKEVKITKKGEAIAKGNNLHASMKQCMYICRFIKNKPIDDAIKLLEDVIKMKRAVPFSGEIPHRKGKMMSGRYPINASKLFIPILKSLRGNILVNQMDLDKTRIYFASASYASRPSKRGGGRFKRTNLVLKAMEVPEKVIIKSS